VDSLGHPLKQILLRLLTALRQLLQDRRLYLRLQLGSALGLGVGLVLAALLISDVFTAPSTRLSDVIYQTPVATRHVVIVAIDDASVQAIGPLPWSRATLAVLIDAIARASPRVIALDVILPEPSQDDVLLARALEGAPRVIQPVIGVEATLATAAFPRFDFVLTPAPLLRTSNTSLAHTSITPDSDGIVRHIPLAIESQGQRYPALGLAAFAAFQQRLPDVRLEHRTVVWDTQRLPTDASGRMKIIFVHPQTRVVIPAAAILRGDANMDILRDRIVLVGVTQSRARLFVPPTLSTPPLTSVEVHANVIETLLRNHLLTPQDRLTEIVMIFLLAILAGATLPHLRLLSALALTIIYVLLYLGYAFALFSRGTLVQPLYPVLALLLVLIGAMIFRYFSHERRRAALSHLFRRYVSPDTIEQVMRGFDRDSALLSGTQRRVSVLCIDLRDVNYLADTFSPAALFQILNQYTRLITTPIFQHNGTLIECNGAEILATWNLLLEQPDHARQALSTALQIKQEIAAFNRNHTPPISCHLGMGIATGDVLAGRLHLATSTEYTIIGECVSVAERLAVRPERSIFIDAATCTHVGDEFPLREIKPIKLRRKTDPHRIWQIVPPAEETETGEWNSTEN